MRSALLPRSFAPAPGSMVCVLTKRMPGICRISCSASSTSWFTSGAEKLPRPSTATWMNCGSESEKKIVPTPNLP